MDYELSQALQARFLAIEGVIAGLAATLIQRDVLDAEDVIENLEETEAALRQQNHHAEAIGTVQRIVAALRADFPPGWDDETGDD
jgi:hypothetical protein